MRYNNVTCYSGQLGERARSTVSYHGPDGQAQGALRGANIKGTPMVIILDGNAEHVLTWKHVFGNYFKLGSLYRTLEVSSVVKTGLNQIYVNLNRAF